MGRTGDGDYEMVLGNKQLLSIFFVVVILLGVGFTAGYLLGRNSSNQVAARTPDGMNAEPTVTAPPESSTPRIEASSPGTSAKPIPAPTKTEPAVVDSKSRTFRSGQPPSGTVFIQVAALAKVDADHEAGTLVARGFPVWVAPSASNAELFSVLVGPYAEKADLAKAKTRLEDLGFRKAFRKEIK